MLFPATNTHSIDDAGIYIKKRVLAPTTIPGNYRISSQNTGRIPSLSSICLQILAEFPDQIKLPFRLNYRTEITHPSSFPTLSHLDPRLWITLIQVYDALPLCLRSYNIPLSDIHLPLLQRVPSTPQFSLLTVLDLPACPDLTDDSISGLKLLHSLVAFDASATTLSSYAVKVLARTLVYTEYDTTRRGPWTLRILRLRNCKNIDNNVYSHISLFPLLSVVDLRGTCCTRHPSTIFRPASTSNSILYHPSPLPAALTFLQSTSPLHSSQNTFSLHVSTLHHPPLPHRQSTITPQNSFVVIPSKVNGLPSKLITGDAETQSVYRPVDAKWLSARTPAAWHQKPATVPNDSKDDHKEPSFHSKDCFCGGEYDPRVQEDVHNDVNDEEESEEFYDDASDRYSQDDSEEEQYDSESDSDGYRYEDESWEDWPSPSFVDACVAPITPAPRSISANDARPLLPPTPVVNAQENSPATLSTPTTGTQRPPQSLLASQAPHYNSVSTTASFYYRDIHRDKLSRGADQGYSADPYYARARTHMKDERDKCDAFLMLYRDPPAWNMLEMATSGPGPSVGNVPAKSNKKHATARSTGDLNRTEGVKKKDVEKQAALVALRNAATRRVSMQEGSIHPHAHAPFPTPSRNPFRREIPEAKQNIRTRGLPLLSLSHLQDITRTDPRQGSVKPLKPISAVKVPSLPSELRRQSSSSPASTKATATTTKQVKIRSEMNKVGACGPFGSVDVAAPVTLSAAKLKPRENINVGTLKRSTSMGEVKAANKKSRFSDRVNLEDPSEGVKKGEARRHRRSFDWSGWAAHGK